MVELLNTESVERFAARLNAIQPETKPNWGTLTPTGVMAHLNYMASISLGETATEDKSNIFFRTVVRYLMFHLITTWPKGIKAPEQFTPSPAGEFEAERDRLLDSIRRFVDAAATTPDRMTVHPVFGPSTLDSWTRLHGVHFAHHFRQFGV